jgi:CubicO group peptidase (beta-lactamase class C family)
MVDQGHLSYTTPISTYWPLFASKDKSHLTTQHILQHQAGLWVFDQSISLEQMLTANIKQNSIGKIIE